MYICIYTYTYIIYIHPHIYTHISITYVYTRCIYSCQLKIKTECTHILTVSFDDLTKRKIFLFVYLFICFLLAQRFPWY